MPEWPAAAAHRAWHRCELSPPAKPRSSTSCRSISTIATRSCGPRARRRRRRARIALEELQDHDTLARRMRSLRQAHMPTPIPPGCPGRGAAWRPLARICAMPSACCASSPASRPPPSSRSRSASAPTPRSSASSTPRCSSGCRWPTASVSSRSTGAASAACSRIRAMSTLRDGSRIVRRVRRLGRHRRQPARGRRGRARARRHRHRQLLRRARRPTRRADDCSLRPTT